jgi:hypothetical protein
MQIGQLVHTTQSAYPVAWNMRRNMEVTRKMCVCVMGSQQAATSPIGPRRQMQKGVVGRECPSWALSPLVLISVSLSYLYIGIVSYCLDTRGVSPMYPL